ncbi:hypothetical protein JW710_04415 [Candidatus Dojkabacteria bacterium]|nr:hypothetical protein [Candidatus Dojkabacteria bacterium]
MENQKKIVVTITTFFMILGIATFVIALVRSGKSSSTSNDTSKPNQSIANRNEENSTETVKLVFIHHSTGENWLSDENGRLGIELRDAGYFVSDTNYGWGPDSIGDRTDIGNWWEWFRGPQSQTPLQALYAESGQNSQYSRLSSDPGGENTIVMFKSCFPNSYLGGSTSESVPSISDNPLVGQSADSEYHTVANAKGIYIDLLKYFETEQDKLFIVVTAPPLGRNNSDSKHSSNARAFNNWLKNDWITDYEYDNVAVFDFFDILTANGESNYLEYYDDEYDDHPSMEGNRIATEEFILFLNEAYADFEGK